MVKRTQTLVSLSRFKRESNQLIKKLMRTGKPIVLTVNGKIQLVVQTVDAYQRLEEAASRWETDAVRLGLHDADAGRTHPMRELVSALGFRSIGG